MGVDKKTIALVGPAPSIIGMELGTVIDEHDIVVRLNGWTELPPEDYGTRTDLIIVSTKFHAESCVARGFPASKIKSKFQFCNRNRMRNWKPKDLSRVRLLYTTGMIALSKLLDLSDEVNVFGFTFYDNTEIPQHHPDCYDHIVPVARYQKALENEKNLKPGEYPGRTHRFDIEELIAYKLWQDGQIGVDPYLEMKWTESPPSISELR